MFELKEKEDLIFRNGPSFMGPFGMYLNILILDFDLEVDVPSTVLV